MSVAHGKRSVSTLTQMSGADTGSGSWDLIKFTGIWSAGCFESSSDTRKPSITRTNLSMLALNFQTELKLERGPNFCDQYLLNIPCPKE